MIENFGRHSEAFQRDNFLVAETVAGCTEEMEAAVDN